MYELRQNWKKPQLPDCIPAVCGKWTHKPKQTCRSNPWPVTIPVGRWVALLARGAVATLLHTAAALPHAVPEPLLQLSLTSHRTREPDTAPASFLLLFMEQDRVSIRKTGARSGNQHQGPGGPHHKQEEFQCHISPPSKACLEPPLHTRSLRRQLPCTSCKIYSL